MTKIDEIFDKHWRENSYSLESDIKLMMKDYAEWYAKKCLNLAAKQAETCFWSTNTDGEEQMISKRLLMDYDYKYSNSFDCLPTITVNQDTILNIKLPEHD